MLAERGPAAVSAWQTLFGQITSTLEVPFDAGEGEEPHTIDRLLAHVRDPDRDLRRRALETLYVALEPHTRTLAHCYDTLVGDRLAMDRLRGYAAPMEPTHLRNELSRPGGGAACSTRSSATTASPTAGSRSRRGILGLDRLELHDQYAPIGDGRSVDYPEARRLIDESFGRFSPRVARLAGGFFDEQPHRRRAALGQARRRLLRAGRPGRLALRADELHRPDGRRHDPGPRAGARHALHPRVGGADRPLDGHRHRAGRGPLDLRRAAGVRPPPRGRDRPGHAPGADLRARRGLVRHGLPPDRADPLRAARLRAARRGRHAHPRAAVRDLDRGEPQVLRRLAGAARGLPPRLVVHPPLHLAPASTPTPTCSRTWPPSRCTRATASWASRSWTPTSASCRRAARRGPTELLGALGVDVDDPAVWEPGFGEIERMVGVAEAG